MTAMEARVTRPDWLIRRRGRPLPLVVWGTGPNSGKTHLCLGLARSLIRRGIRVTPFKAVTVLDTASRRSGGQWASQPIPIPLHVTAAAASWQPDLAPVVVLPTEPGRGEIMVDGERVSTVELATPDTLDLGRLDPGVRELLVGRVEAALARLSAPEGGVLLVEGAGSPVDAVDDLANLAVVRLLAGSGAPPPARVILSNYCGFGAAVAAICGTHALLPEDVLGNIIGYVLSGPLPGAPVDAWSRTISERTSVRRLGVIPHLPSYSDRAGRLSAEELAQVWGDTVEAAIDHEALLGEPAPEPSRG